MSIDLTPAPTDFAQGDHVCGFYYGEEERDALLLPFLRAGLRDGDKCVAVVDSTSPHDVVTRIGGTDADALIAAANLERALTQALRIALDGPLDADTATPGLKALLTRAGEVADFAVLQKLLADLQARARQIFERVMQG